MRPLQKVHSTRRPCRRGDMPLLVRKSKKGTPSIFARTAPCEDPAKKQGIYESSVSRGFVLAPTAIISPSRVSPPAISGSALTWKKALRTAEAPAFPARLLKAVPVFPRLTVKHGTGSCIVACVKSHNYFFHRNSPFRRCMRLKTEVNTLLRPIKNSAAAVLNFSEACRVNRQVSAVKIGSVRALRKSGYFTVSFFTNVPSIPFIKDTVSGSSYFFASSSASFMETPSGMSGI